MTMGKTRLVSVFLLTLITVFYSNTTAQFDHPDDYRWNLQSIEPGANSFISDIAVIGTDLYIVGIFTTIGGRPAERMARLDTETNTWYDFGDDITSRTPFNHVPRVLYAYGSKLFVSGQLAEVAGIETGNLAMYNTETSTWHRVYGDGPTDGTINRMVADGDTLYLAGSDVRKVILTDGSVEIIGTLSTSGNIGDIAISDGYLYITGEFSSVNDVNTLRLARYNLETGIWSSVHDGLSGSGMVLLDDDEYLFFGGNFPSPAGTTGLQRLMRYRKSDGEWLGMDFPNQYSVTSLGRIGNQLYVGGTFLRVGGSVSARYIARYDLESNTWHNMGYANNSVDRMVVAGSTLYVNGHFTMIDSKLYGNYGSVASWDHDLMQWNESLFHGSGLNESVYAIAANGEKLYVGGKFTHLGPDTLAYLATFDVQTETWAEVPGQFSEGASIRALINSGDYLYVAGTFNTIDNLPSRNVARLHVPTQTWEALGSGNTKGVNNSVHAMVVDDGYLYVGGQFTQAGGLSASRIARLNLDTNTWEALGNGVDGTVRALALHNNHIYVGGDFNRASGTFSRRITRYDTQTGEWYHFQQDLNQSVQDILVHDNQVYITGAFTFAGGGGGSVPRLARFDPANETWHTVGNANLSSTGYKLLVHDDKLYVAGAFGRLESHPDLGNVNRLAAYDFNTGEWSSFLVAA
jgi:trimeric autotransporter adhesin